CSSDEESAGSSSSDEESNNHNKRSLEQSSIQKAKKSSTSDDSSSNEGSKTLFVGNLSFNVDKDWLYSEFKDCGQIVDVRIITDRATGRPKGFGYVQFADADGAASGIELKGRVIDGR